MVPASNVAPGAKVGGLAAQREGLGRALGDLESHRDTQTHQVQSQAKPMDIEEHVCVCGHATGKHNMLRARHVQEVVGPIGWKGGPNREGCRQRSLSPVAGQQGLLYYSLHCTHMHFFCKSNISHNSFYFLKKLW